MSIIDRLMEMAATLPPDPPAAELPPAPAAETPAPPQPERPYCVCYLMGRCADGAERDKGRLLHAVKHGRAFCRATHGRQSAGWSEHQEGVEVTCRGCLRKLGLLDGEPLSHDVVLALPDDAEVRIMVTGEEHRWIFRHVLRVCVDRELRLYCETKLVVDWARGVLADKLVLSMHVVLPEKLGQAFVAGVDVSEGAKTYLEWTYAAAGDRFRLRELCRGANDRHSFEQEPGLVRAMPLPFPVLDVIEDEGRSYRVPFRKDEAGNLGYFTFPRTTLR